MAVKRDSNDHAPDDRAQDRHRHRPDVGVPLGGRIGRGLPGNADRGGGRVAGRVAAGDAGGGDTSIAARIGVGDEARQRDKHRDGASEPSDAGDSTDGSKR
jgi:hypothetical protein